MKHEFTGRSALFVYIFAGLVSFFIAFFFIKFHHDTKDPPAVPQPNTTQIFASAPPSQCNAPVTAPATTGSGGGFVTSRPAVIP